MHSPRRPYRAYKEPNLATGATAWMTLAIATFVALAACCARPPEPTPSTGPTIAPAELVHELMTQPGRWTVYDLRDEAQFQSFHLPGAIRIDAEAIPEPRPDQHVALCGDPAICSQTCASMRDSSTNAQVFALAASPETVRDAWLSKPQGVSPWTSGLEDRFAMQKAYLLGAQKNPRAPGDRHATDPEQLTSPTMVSTAWLEDHLEAVSVVDVRSLTWFAPYHVPGARQLNVRNLRQKRGDTYNLLATQQRLAEQFARAGVRPRQPAVIVAGPRMLDATFTALALVHLGHQQVAILEGGMLAWASERRPLTGSSTPAPAAAHYPLRPQSEPLPIATAQVATAIAANSAQVLDCRPHDSFTGERSRDRRKGHIPGAKNRPFAEDVRPEDSGTWLRGRSKLLEAYGEKLASDQPVIVSCRTGHAASQTYFVLRYLLGYDAVRWHNGSWLEWSARDDLPAELGEEQAR